MASNIGPIKKGEDLLLVVNERVEIPVVAASDEHDGFVEIKQKGSFSTCPVGDLKRVSSSEV